MDSPTLNHVSLCAGYGGIDLGLRRAIPSLRTVAFAEIEGFACANLVAKMEAGLLDSAPIWTDLKTFPYAKFRGLVDILSGGYPCQPFSAAGQRRGKDDPRHLWPWIADGIAAMRPAVCFFENVEGHISLGLSDVIEDLAGMGYRTTWGIFSAAEVGAPHQRKRVFILANRIGARLEGLAGNVQGAKRESDGSGRSVAASSLSLQSWPSRPGQPQFDWEPPRVVANPRSQELNRLSQPTRRNESSQIGIASDGLGDAADAGLSLGRPGAVQQSGAVEESKRSDVRAEWETESALGRDSDGSPDRLGNAKLFTSSDNRTDELRLLGNGVVPATAERAFRVLMEQLYAANT